MANRRTKEPSRTPSAAGTPINHERLRQIFANMRGRSFTVSFVPVGPVVEAATPDELVAATERATIRATKKQTQT